VLRTLVPVTVLVAIDANVICVEISDVPVALAVAADVNGIAVERLLLPVAVQVTLLASVVSPIARPEDAVATPVVDEAN
jgi:hypothetical protein